MRLRRASDLIIGAVLIFGLSGQAAGQRRRGAGVQTIFGTEMPVRRPVRLPRDVIRQILTSDPERVQTCVEHAGESPEEIAGGLVGSGIDINGDGVLDLVAQAATSRCFMGAHSTTFWVFSKAETRLAPGFDLTLTSGADYLAVCARGLTASGISKPATTRPLRCTRPSGNSTGGSTSRGSAPLRPSGRGNACASSAGADCRGEG